MKYVFECTYSHCRERGNAISEITEKMYAIEDNLEFLIGTYATQHPEEAASSLLSLQYAEQLYVDLDNASDEFYIENNKTYIHLEVVAREIAESNDKEFLSGNTEALEMYSLADGIYSYYTRLASTDYYFRFM